MNLTIVTDEEDCTAIYLEGKYIGKEDQLSLRELLIDMGAVKIVLPVDWDYEWPDRLSDLAL